MRLYPIPLDHVVETMTGKFGVAIRVKSDDRPGTEWYIAVPNLDHIAGPYGNRKKVAKILDTAPDPKQRLMFLGRWSSVESRYGSLLK